MTQSLLTDLLAETGEVYQGQFGEFTIDRHDRLEVLLYRGGLLTAATSFAVGTALVGWHWAVSNQVASSGVLSQGGLGDGAIAYGTIAYGTPGQGLPAWQGILPLLTGLYGIFCLALGVSLLTIHIYLKPLHRALQIFWGIGCLTSLIIAFSQPDPLAFTVYTQPLTLLGVGFTFAALTGIFFKEAFCFNRFETKFLTILVPLLLLGHLLGWLPPGVEMVLLWSWAGLFALFALRKTWQAIPADIGDKSVFSYLQQRSGA
jgi:uncharacterized integral membrane protein